jgi:hypothetical protein
MLDLPAHVKVGDLSDQFILEHALQAAGTVLGPEALLNEVLLGTAADGEGEVGVGQLLEDAGTDGLQFDVEDLTDGLLGEGAEDDLVLDTVDELSGELLLDWVFGCRARKWILGGS